MVDDTSKPIPVTKNKLMLFAYSTVEIKANPNTRFNAITIFENLFICLFPFFLSINYDVSLTRLWNLAMRLFEVLIAKLLYLND